MPHNIAIIGQGNVGTALEKSLHPAGHETKTVGKDPDRVAELAGWADIIILAVPFGERSNVMDEIGDNANGKTLVDVTNATMGSNEFAASLDESGAEEIQGMAPDANVVKCFNTVFAEHMTSGELQGEDLTVFAAGDDEDARETVLSIAQDIGFDAVDAGPLENARWLEPIGFFNMQLAFDLDMGTHIGFRLVQPSAQ